MSFAHCFQFCFGHTCVARWLKQCIRLRQDPSAVATACWLHGTCCRKAAHAVVRSVVVSSSSCSRSCRCCFCYYFCYCFFLLSCCSFGYSCSSCSCSCSCYCSSSSSSSSSSFFLLLLLLLLLLVVVVEVSLCWFVCLLVRLSACLLVCSLEYLECMSRQRELLSTDCRLLAVEHWELPAAAGTRLSQRERPLCPANPVAIPPWASGLGNCHLGSRGLSASAGQSSSAAQARILGYWVAGRRMRTAEVNVSSLA